MGGVCGQHLVHRSVGRVPCKRSPTQSGPIICRFLFTRKLTKTTKIAGWLLPFIVYVHRLDPPPQTRPLSLRSVTERELKGNPQPWDGKTTWRTDPSLEFTLPGIQTERFREDWFEKEEH